MKYDKPQLTAVMPAIGVIQAVTTHKEPVSDEENSLYSMIVGSYEDWE